MLRFLQNYRAKVLFVWVWLGRLCPTSVPGFPDRSTKHSQWKKSLALQWHGTQAPSCTRYFQVIKPESWGEVQGQEHWSRSFQSHVQRMGGATQQQHQQQQQQRPPPAEDCCCRRGRVAPARLRTHSALTPTHTTCNLPQWGPRKPERSHEASGSQKNHLNQRILKFL